MDPRTLTRMARDRIRNAFDQVWPRWSDPIADGAYGHTEIRTASAPLLRRFFAAVDAALKAIEDGCREAATAHGQTMYTAEERQRRATAALTAARAEYDGQSQTALEALNALVAAARAAGVPARPGPADAAQEAALANERADLRMMLDPVPAAELHDRILAIVGDAAADGNRLRVWLLAGSAWAADYLASRGAAQQIDLLRANLGPVLAPAAGKQVAEAVRAWQLLEPGRDAARRLVDTYLPLVASDEFDDASSMRAS